jgi:hypothetical protein
MRRLALERSAAPANRMATRMMERNAQSALPPVTERAQQEFPILQSLGLSYVDAPRENAGYLEFWPSDERGTLQHPRPQAIPAGKAGVEVRSTQTRPIDVMGDVASHHMIETDPYVKGYYQSFQQSLEPWQRERLREQYEYSRENFGEDRPFEQWLEMSGMPGYFRGHPFQQWEDSARMYTPGQIESLDDMMAYLRGQKHPLQTRKK